MSTTYSQHALTSLLGNVHLCIASVTSGIVWCFYFLFICIYFLKLKMHELGLACLPLIKEAPPLTLLVCSYRLFIDTMFTQSIYFTVKSNPCTCMCADTPWTIFLRHVSLIEIVRGGRIINQRSTYGMQPFLDNQRIANLICKTSIYVCRFPPRSINGT